MIKQARELLARTGVQLARDDDDPGHISNRWRREIEQLLGALEAAPLDVGEKLQDALRHQDVLRERIHDLLAQKSAIEEQLAYERSQLEPLRSEVYRLGVIVNPSAPRNNFGS